LSDRFGGIAANVARGITVRADNGPRYIARHFTRQLAHWGMLSHAFPHQPETNGVCERIFRTLKEQAIFGRAFRTISEVQSAVDQFVANYNVNWRLARLGFRSPLEYRLHRSASVNMSLAA
jgi:transposase InsO family protein